MHQDLDSQPVSSVRFVLPLVCFRAVQHAACISYRARCWLVQANEQLETQLREAQRAQQASEAQAGQLQAAENRVRCMHVCAKRLPNALQSVVAKRRNIWYTLSLASNVSRKAL